jgi:hypothetical protein
MAEGVADGNAPDGDGDGDGCQAAAARQEPDGGGDGRKLPGRPSSGGKRKMVFRGLPRACWEVFLWQPAEYDKGLSMNFFVHP